MNKNKIIFSIIFMLIFFIIASLYLAPPIYFLVPASNIVIHSVFSAINNISLGLGGSYFHTSILMSFTGYILLGLFSIVILFTIYKGIHKGIPLAKYVFIVLNFLIAIGFILLLQISQVFFSNFNFQSERTFRLSLYFGLILLPFIVNILIGLSLKVSINATSINKRLVNILKLCLGVVAFILFVVFILNPLKIDIIKGNYCIGFINRCDEYY